MIRKNIERFLWIALAISVTFLAISYDRNRTETVVASNPTVIFAPNSANPEALSQQLPTASDTVDVDYDLPLSANPEALRDQNSMTLLPGETWTYQYAENNQMMREVVVMNLSGSNLNFDMSLFYYSPDDLRNCPHSVFVEFSPSDLNVVYVGSSTELRLSSWGLVYEMWSYLCGPRVAPPENFDYYVTYSQK